MNVLDFPTAVIPVTFVEKDVDKLDPGFRPLSHRDRINMNSCKCSFTDLIKLLGASEFSSSMRLLTVPR